MRSPGTKNLNILAAKKIAFTERYDLDFRMEFFNAFNRVQFAGPNISTNLSSFGQIFLNQANTPREIQAGLRLSLHAESRLQPRLQQRWKIPLLLVSHLKDLPPLSASSIPGYSVSPNGQTLIVQTLIVDRTVRNTSRLYTLKEGLIIPAHP